MVSWRASLQEIVEVGAAGGHLQPVDAAIATVVEQHDGQLQPQHDRRGDLGIQHQVGAVAHHDDDLLVGPRHLDAQPAGDLVAHAGIAIFGMVGAGVAGLPELVQLARQAAGGMQQRSTLAAHGALHRADHLGIGRQRGVGGGGDPGGGLLPLGLALAAPSRSSRRAPASRRAPRGSSFEPLARVGNQGSGAVLAGIERLHVEADDRSCSFLNSAQEPVVKSCSRVPTASTRSASSARRLAAEVPVTPTAPMLSGCSSGSDDLPPCVSQTGMPVASANSASAADACE